jgi:hypothetical protein
MKILLRVFSSDEYNDDEIGAAFVELSSEQAKMILMRIAIFNQHLNDDEKLVEEAFADDLCCFIDQKVLSEKIGDDVEELWNEEHLETDINFYEHARGDISFIYMNVGKDWVAWEALPDHSGINISTAALEANFIETLIKAEPKPEAKKDD